MSHFTAFIPVNNEQVTGGTGKLRTGGSLRQAGVRVICFWLVLTHFPNCAVKMYFPSGSLSENVGKHFADLVPLFSNCRLG